ncbi:endonuclease domain-containing protein [Ancylomarina sp. YFZ004]
MKRYINKPILKAFRKRLRNRSTASEATLWKMLKNRQVEGLKFRRQSSIGNYIVDFYCPEIKLILELDGSSHDNYLSEELDAKRDKELRDEGYFILRYENHFVYDYPKEIIEGILKIIRFCKLEKK